MPLTFRYTSGLSHCTLPRSSTRQLGGAGNVATIETRLSGTDAELAELFSVARAAFETLARECETGAADAARAESVRNALRSKKATDLAAALRRDRPDEAN